MSARRVLITGGAGFIGSHTADALLARGWDVRVLDNLTPRIHPKGKPAYLDGRIELLEGDVTDPATFARALDGVTHVYHLAAYQDYLPDFSTFYRVNAVSTALLYEIAVERRLPLEKIVIASSQAAYGEGKYECPTHGVVYPPLRENARLERGAWDPPCPHAGCTAEIRPVPTDEAVVNPHNSYALSKYTQERIGLTLGERYGLPTTALRYSIVQGPRQSFYNAYSGACRIFSLSYHFNKAPTVYEDGAQLRDYVNIHDVAAANVLALEDPRTNGQAYNVGGGVSYSVLEFAAIVAKVFGTDLAPEIPGAYRFGDTRHIISDISRLRALGWRPTRTPEDSVRAYAAWLRGQDNVEDIRAYAEKHMAQLNVVRKVKR